MSFKLISAAFLNRKILLSEDVDDDNNIYTLITGKNGLGKTRLLNFIIYHFIKNSLKKTSYHYRYHLSDDFDMYDKITNYTLEYTQSPTKIIVHTNSKFNKFPDSYSIAEKNYINISENSPRHRSPNNIFERILFSKDINLKSVNDTLSYLGYASKIRFKINVLSDSSTSGYLNKMTAMHENILKILNFDLTKPPQKFKKNEKKLLSILYYLNERGVKTPTLDELKNLYILIEQKKILDYFHAVTISLESNKYDYGFLEKSDFNLLLKFNLIAIYDIFLDLKDNNTNYLFLDKKSENGVSFYSLSSGQKSIINTLLGISGVIENNCLVCIDEPEISLHPEWQNEIIQKIQEAFSEKKGCHFLIATHSPQVVSGLNCENGFILDLENDITYKSNIYSKKSADYQLAKLFNAPGYNNEYIIKISLYLLSKIKDRVSFNSSDLHNISELKKFQESLKEDDPVHYLVKEVLSLSEV